MLGMLALIGSSAAQTVVNVPWDMTLDDALDAAQAANVSEASEFVIRLGAGTYPFGGWVDGWSVTIEALEDGVLLVPGASAGSSVVHLEVGANAVLRGVDIDCEGSGRRMVTVDPFASLTLERASVTGCWIADDPNPLDGGTILSHGETFIRDSTFGAGTAGDDGGHIFVDGGALTISGSRFVGGDARYGGSISGDDATITIVRSAIDQSTAEWGGALNAWQSDLLVSDSRITDGAATEGGGLIYSNRDLDVERSVLCEGWAPDGAAIYWEASHHSDSTFDLHASVVLLNTATSGAPIELDDGNSHRADAALSRSAFLHNQGVSARDLRESYTDDGGDLNEDTLEVARCLAAGTAGPTRFKASPQTESAFRQNRIDAPSLNGFQSGFDVLEGNQAGGIGLPAFDQTCSPFNARGSNTGVGPFGNFDGAMLDVDNDGFIGPDDCDDSSASVNVQGSEGSTCDGIDNDCDGRIDEGLGTLFYRDADGDGLGDGTAPAVRACSAPSGFVANDTDCNDGLVGADATDWYLDVDRDDFGTGPAVPACTQPTPTFIGVYVLDGGDCNDVPGNGGANDFPNAPEVCDGRDNDCDNEIDENITINSYPDVDRDTFGDRNTPVQQVCVLAPGFVSNGTDCNDALASIRPTATEVCDGIDNNCNDQIDEGLLVPRFPDADRDGFGSSTSAAQQVCPGTSGLAASNLDCDDTDDEVFPGAVEVCNGKDDNCVDGIDEGLRIPTYVDADGDGQGAEGTSSTLTCPGLPQRSSNATDCDDTESQDYLGAPELCDERDNDCDDDIDESIVDQAYYPDADGDGNGDPNGDVITSCSRPPGHVLPHDDCDDTDATVGGPTLWYQNLDGDLYGDANTPARLGCLAIGTEIAQGLDCDDSAADVFPGALEICDGIDNNCDGLVDIADPRVVLNTYFPDSDGDGFGAEGSAPIEACAQGPGFSDNAGDCDDTEDTVRPDASEICDGLDNNCDGEIDNGVTTFPTYYLDQDGDGFGDAFDPQLADTCELPSDVVLIGGDCDDSDHSIHPEAPEVCDNVDNNCDSEVDEGLRLQGWPDADDDGYGDATAEPVEMCELLRGFAADALDCDDRAAEVNPGAVEVCDTLDNDCNGVIDDAPGCDLAEDSVNVLGLRCDQSGLPPGLFVFLGLPFLLGRRRT